MYGKGNHLSEATDPPGASRLGRRALLAMLGLPGSEFNDLAVRLSNRKRHNLVRKRTGYQDGVFRNSNFSTNARIFSGPARRWCIQGTPYLGGVLMINQPSAAQLKS
jgi:hypothetical protein